MEQARLRPHGAPRPTALGAVRRLRAAWESRALFKGNSPPTRPPRSSNCLWPETCRELSRRTRRTPSSSLDARPTSRPPRRWRGPKGGHRTDTSGRSPKPPQRPVTRPRWAPRSHAAKDRFRIRSDVFPHEHFRSWGSGLQALSDPQTCSSHPGDPARPAAEAAHLSQAHRGRTGAARGCAPGSGHPRPEQPRPQHRRAEQSTWHPKTREELTHTARTVTPDAGSLGVACENRPLSLW